MTIGPVAGLNVGDGPGAHFSHPAHVHYPTHCSFQSLPALLKLDGGRFASLVEGFEPHLHDFDLDLIEIRGRQSTLHAQHLYPKNPIVLVEIEDDAGVNFLRPHNFGAVQTQVDTIRNAAKMDFHGRFP
ncbi:hypothetical protein BH24CHL4_BH24CHL4_25660 [soil metagenome]